MHGMFMEASRRILPRILDIYPCVVGAFDFDACTLNRKSASGNPDHSGGSWSAALGVAIGHDLLAENLPLVRVTGERFGGELLHIRH